MKKDKNYKTKLAANQYLRVFLMMVLITLMAISVSACGSKSEELPDSDETLTAGTYAGVLIVKEIPMVVYAQKALDDPESLPELDGEEAEACEEIDLNNAEVRTQIEDAIEKGNSTIGVEVPLTIIITEGAIPGEFTGTIKADFASAFPDYGCEEATDEPYVLTHSPGKITLQNITDEESVETTSLFEGAILKDGVIQGNFYIKNASAEYLEFTGSDIMMTGTWEVKK